MSAIPAVIVSLLVFATLAKGVSSNPYERLLERGLASYNNFDLENARADFRRAIAINKDDPTGYYGCSIVEFSAKQLASAKEDYDRAARCGTGNRVREPSISYIIRGIAKLQQGDREAGLSDLDQAIAKQTRSARALVIRAQLSCEQKGPIPNEQVATALPQINRALEIDPSLAFGYAVRGDLELRANGDRQDWKAALADEDRAIARDPRCIYAYLVREWLKGANGDHDGRRTDLDAIISKAPHTPGAYCERAEMKFAANEIAGALADLELSVKEDPSSATAAYEAIAFLKHKTGDEAGALASCNQAIEHQPSAPMIELRAQICEALKDYDSAINDYTDLINDKGKLPQWVPTGTALWHLLSEMGATAPLDFSDMADGKRQLWGIRRAEVVLHKRQAALRNGNSAVAAKELEEAINEYVAVALWDFHVLPDGRLIRKPLGNHGISYPAEQISDAKKRLRELLESEGVNVDDEVRKGREDLKQRYRDLFQRIPASP